MPLEGHELLRDEPQFHADLISQGNSWIGSGDDQVRGQGGLRRAHAPDVQAMHFGDSPYRREMAPVLLDVDA